MINQCKSVKMPNYGKEFKIVGSLEKNPSFNIVNMIRIDGLAKGGFQF